MLLHNKRLQYTVRVAQPNPKLANLLLEQFGGANGELAAAARYFTQALAEEDPGRKDLLMDIACGFHDRSATYSMNIRPLIPR